MILLALEDLRGNKHGKVAVFDSNGLNVIIKPALDLLPDRIGPRLSRVSS